MASEISLGGGRGGGGGDTNVERCVRGKAIYRSLFRSHYILAVEGSFPNLSLLSGLTQTGCLFKFSRAGLCDQH